MHEIGKRYRFSASHRLHSDEFSEAENVRVFGKCANPYGHGHNYVVEVRVEGDPDPATGWVADRARLDRLVEEQIIQRLDRADMNCDIPEFGELVPTTENLSIVIGRWLQQSWAGAFPDGGPRLAGLRIEETPRNSFELTL